MSYDVDVNQCITILHNVADDTEGYESANKTMSTAGETAAKDPAAHHVEPAASDAPWQHSFTADPVLLFRYSALTANSHRIHYDAPYCREVERYPGLVVHGPLLVTLLCE